MAERVASTLTTDTSLIESAGKGVDDSIALPAGSCNWRMMLHSALYDETSSDVAWIVLAPKIHLLQSNCQNVAPSNDVQIKKFKVVTLYRLWSLKYTPSKVFWVQLDSTKRFGGKLAVLRTATTDGADFRHVWRPNASPYRVGSKRKVVERWKSYRMVSSNVHIVCKSLPENEGDYHGFVTQNLRKVNRSSPWPREHLTRASCWWPIVADLRADLLLISSGRLHLCRWETVLFFFFRVISVSTHVSRTRLIGRASSTNFLFVD